MSAGQPLARRSFQAAPLTRSTVRAWLRSLMVASLEESRSSSLARNASGSRDADTANHCPGPVHNSVASPSTYDIVQIDEFGFESNALVGQTQAKPGSKWHGDAVAVLFAEIADGTTPGVKTSNFQNIMGRPGTSLREFLEKIA